MNTSVRFFMTKLSRWKPVKDQISCRRISTTNRYRARVNISYAVYPAEASLGDAGHKVPIFVLHGLFGSKKNWHSLAKSLASLTHRIVVTLDARNHGESDQSPKMDYELMRDDLLGIMDKLKVERPILIGHSMGGKTAMTCALSKPERVSSLIVVDTAPKPSPAPENLLKYAEFMEEMTLPEGIPFLEGRRQVADKLRSIIKTEGEVNFLLTNLKETRQNSLAWKVNLDAVITNLKILTSFPDFSKPCEISTTFIGGSLSSENAVPYIERLFPSATITRIYGAGHWVHSEKPREFEEAVLDFITNVHVDIHES